MAAVGFCSEWFVFSCGSELVAVHSRSSRDPFVFDCSAAEKRPKNATDENSDGGSEETGSDRVLAFAASPSGKLLALTDDNKRLILLRRESSWQHISTRFVVRRCTSLCFSRAEDQLLVADKSGDVYSFSVEEPQKDGELKMGHLSMLLAVTMSADDRYIITADRDEKIRVSHLGSPYNVQSFCLGHTQFVSALLVPAGRPGCLLSGSGDGTLKLWDFESGRRLQSCDLERPEETASSGDDKQKRSTVCRICSSPDARVVAVQCERASSLQFFSLAEGAEPQLVPHSRLSLTCGLVDVTFDPEGRLWALTESSEEPLQIYACRRERWEVDVDSPDLHRVTEVFRRHWESLDASARTSSRFEHLQKVSYDNVTAYLQKKQQRLDEQRLKRTKAPPTANGGKKARTPDTSRASS